MEKFVSRGIGFDLVKCFVCGTDKIDIDAHVYLNNISGFVESKESGEKIVKMFEHGARLDYRPREPRWIQVKIGACDSHLTNLEHLNQLVQDGLISKKKVDEARHE